MKIEGILDDYIAPALPAILDTTTAICLDGIAGALVPGVGNMMLGYKQRQQEKRFEQAIEEIRNRQEEINKILDDFNDEMKPKVERLLDIYFDYCINNNQEEKVKLLANGYIKSIKIENPQEDVLFGFYDTLEQLNMLDIRVLRLYSKDIMSVENDDWMKILKDYDIDISQYRMIQQKLVRLGLLESQNDIKTDENVELIIDYIQYLSKNKDNEAKLVLKKIKKIPQQDRYSITKYGRNLVKFFIEQ